MIHNRSVMGAIASCGLQPDSFGRSVSIPTWGENREPDNFYSLIRGNKVVSNDVHPI